MRMRLELMVSDRQSFYSLTNVIIQTLWSNSCILCLKEIKRFFPHHEVTFDSEMQTCSGICGLIVMVLGVLFSLSSFSWIVMLYYIRAWFYVHFCQNLTVITMNCMLSPLYPVGKKTCRYPGSLPESQLVLCFIQSSSTEIKLRGAIFFERSMARYPAE